MKRSVHIHLDEHDIPYERKNFLLETEKGGEWGKEIMVNLIDREKPVTGVG